MYPKILPNAQFIADAHYNALGRTEFLEFLKTVLASRPPQLFLLGDVSDLMIGAFKYTLKQNKTLIDLINQIAKSGVEVWYFEGNHDFMLDDVFVKEVNVVTKLSQPKLFDLNGKKAALLHGDYSVELRYEIYAKVIRSKAGLALVNLLTLNFLNNWLLKKLELDLMDKKLDYKIENFLDKRKSKLEKIFINADIVIEGHFHQDISTNFGSVYYRNLPAFACVKSFAKVQSTQNCVSLDTFKFDEIKVGGHLE